MNILRIEPTKFWYHTINTCQYCLKNTPAGHAASNLFHFPYHMSPRLPIDRQSLNCNLATPQTLVR